MPTAEMIDEKIHVTSVWSEKDLIKQIPGASWDKDLKVWTLNLTWVACLQLRGIFGNDLVIGPHLRSWAALTKTDRITPSMELRDRTDVDVWSGNPALYGFQRAGVRFLCQAGSALLADEMGTGKTVQTLETLRTTAESLPAVVICPNSMKSTWKKEAEKWFPDARPYVIAGTAAQRRKTFQLAAQDARAIVIINFESVRAHSRMAGFGSIALKRCRECTKTGFVGVKTSECEVHPRELNQIPFRTVVVDEAHRIKDPNAKQTRAIWAVAQGKHVARRIALTGTSLAKNPADLWSIMHFVAKDEYPTKSAFVSRYCVTAFNSWGGLDVSGLNPETSGEFYRILDPRFRRMPKALVLPQLPEKIRIKRYVPLDEKQRKAYIQIENSLATRLEDGSLLIPQDNLGAQIRLLQFSSSYMTKGEPKKKIIDGEVTWEDTWLMCENSPKLDVMEEILEELGDKQVAVCALSRQLIEMAEKRLQKAGISYSVITGKTPQWEREIQLSDFQSGKNRVMLFTIQAGGVGLTMTAADTIVFLQRSWSMIDNKQAEDRVHRIGSEVHDSINIIDLVAEGTVEETQITRLWEKSQRLEQINRDKAKLIAAGLSVAHLESQESVIMSSNLGVSV